MIIEIALGIVLAFILIATIQFWLPLVVLLALGAALVAGVVGIGVGIYFFSLEPFGAQTALYHVLAYVGVLCWAFLGWLWTDETARPDESKNADVTKSRQHSKIEAYQAYLENMKRRHA